MFQGYEESAKLCGIEILFSRVTKNKIDVEDLKEKISEEIDFIVLCNPMNPHGTILTQKECEILIKEAKNKGCIVIVDEAYGDFADERKYKSCVNFIEKYDNLLVYKSFSKYYGLAGLPCGYALSSENVIEKLNAINRALPFRVNRLACMTAISCLEYKNEFDRMARKIKKNKEFLYKKLTENQVAYIETETNFILIYLDNRIDVDDLCVRLLNEENILVKNGKIFKKTNFIRVGIGTKKNIRRFVKGFVRIYKEMMNNMRKEDTE